jgi:DNA modification methylase
MEKNLLYYGDNLDVLRRYVKDESIDLVYLDPPFKSDQNYNILFSEQDGSRSAAQIKAFEDTWQWDQAAAEAFQEVVEAGGKVSQVMQAFRLFLGDTDMLAYLAMMAPRLMELRRVLKETGSLYLHCDSTASHYLKLLMDAVFGPANFRNEIIWRRTNAHNDPKRYGRIHDVLLFYQKQPGVYFQPQFTSLPRGHVEERFNKRDAYGVYKLENPTGPGPRYGDSGEPWQGFNPTERNRAWAPPRKLCEKLGIDNSLPTRQKLDALLAAGHIELSKTPGSIPMVKVYLEEDDDGQGTAYQDIWAYQPYTQGYYYGDTQSGIDQDVAWIGPTSGERLGYPTQKPVGLLERIVKSSSRQGDIILDPFCGCGTAIAAAQKLNRRWIGIDITHLAISLIKNRLKDAFGDGIEKMYEVTGEPTSLPGAVFLAQQDPYQFQWWALGLVGARPVEQKKGADKGIDGRLYFHDDSKGGPTKQIIFSVKAGQGMVSHLRDLRGVVEREKAQMGVLIAMEEPTKPMRTEAAGAGFYDSPWGSRHPRLQIRTIEELLKGKGVDRPPHQGNVTFKKAPRVYKKQEEQPELL